jgi:choline-sulfatase
VADAAVEFFHKEADQGPWALMVSFVAPHFPLIAPDAYYDLYEPGRLTLPGADLRGAWDHPAVDVFKRSFGLTRELTEGETRACLHAYLALCTFLDSRIGLVVEALGAAGRADDTLVVYTSDHGESAGAHGLWFKHLMNEESVGVPLVVAGPGVPSGVSIDTPVSHIDLFPTLVEWAGLAPEDSADLPGISLMDHDALASADRPVLAEYHANGTVSASFMLRHGRYKYVEYVGERPQLFDLERDPFETEDLAGDPAYAEALAACARRMRDICDPAEVDAAAKADQARRVAAAGGLAAAESITVNYTPVPGELGLG